MSPLPLPPAPVQRFLLRSPTYILTENLPAIIFSSTEEQRIIRKEIGTEQLLFQQVAMRKITAVCLASRGKYIVSQYPTVNWVGFRGPHTANIHVFLSSANIVYSIFVNGYRNDFKRCQEMQFGITFFLYININISKHAESREQLDACRNVFNVFFRNNPQ